MDSQAFALVRQPPLLSTITIAVLVVFLALMGGGVGAGVAFSVAGKSGWAAVAGFVAGALASCALLFVLLRRFNRGPQPPPIVVSATTLSLPRSLRDARSVQVPLAQVRSIEARGRRGAPMIVVSTVDGFFVFPMKAFVDEDAGRRLRGAVRDAIGLLPNGAALLVEMDAREQGGVAATRRKTPATFSLLGIVLVMFAVEAVLGLSSPRTLIMLGANAAALVEDGQWWRLFTAGFLHLSVVHIVLNASVLMNLGSVVEKIVGGPRLVVIALVSSLGGNLASMITRSHTYSAGASAFIFGLIGALLVVNLRHGKKLPGGFNLGPRRWATLLGVNAVISFLPGVDGLAHLGGLVAGAAAAFVLVPELEVVPPKPHPVALALATALGVSFVLAFSVMAARVAGVVAADHGADLVQATLATDKLPAPTRNEVAWAAAIDPTSPPRVLDGAVTAMEQIVGQQREPAWLDTLAYLKFRRGDAIDEIVALEREAAWKKPEPAIFTMLGRFLDEKRAAGAAPGASLSRSDNTVSVEVTAPAQVVFARVVVDGRPTGMVRVVVPAGVTRASVPLPDNVQQNLPPTATFDVLLAGVAGPEGAGAEADMKWAPHDEKTAGLPGRPAR